MAWGPTNVGWGIEDGPLPWVVRLELLAQEDDDREDDDDD